MAASRGSGEYSKIFSVHGSIYRNCICGHCVCTVSCTGVMVLLWKGFCKGDPDFH